METNQMTLLPVDVEFQPDGRALIVKAEANQFLVDAFAEFGEVTLNAGSLAGVNVNCGTKCDVNVICRSVAATA